MITMLRTLSGLAPADDAASDVLRRIALGETVTVDVRKPRSHKRLRRWFALCNLLYQNCEQFKSPDMAHQWLKIMAGHCTQIVSQTTGEVYLVADSIAFSRLDETEFQAVWDRACKAVAEHLLPDIGQATLENEIARMIQ